MKKWIQRNLRNIIATAFVIPILLVAFVSISHVTSFYGLSNPISWAIYLSVGIEVAALSALAAVSVRMGNFIYFPFIIVTIIQMVGNIFFSFSYIDENSESFKDWISMVGGLFENMGVDKTDINFHKNILSFLTGGLLPIISLTFAHMLVKFSEQNKVIEETKVKEDATKKNEDLSQQMSEEEYDEMKQKFIEKKLMEERDLKYKPTMSDIEKFEKFLKDIQYEGPKFTENEVEKFTPYEKELENIEKILNQYGKPEVVEIKEEPVVEEEKPVVETQIEEEIGKVFFEPEETENLYSGDETKEEIAEEIPQEIIEEVKPEPIEMGPSTKILNYFKRND
jgi:hypothetical protein